MKSPNRRSPKGSQRTANSLTVRCNAFFVVLVLRAITMMSHRKPSPMPWNLLRTEAMDNLPHVFARPIPIPEVSLHQVDLSDLSVQKQQSSCMLGLKRPTWRSMLPALAGEQLSPSTTGPRCCSKTADNRSPLHCPKPLRLRLQSCRWFLKRFLHLLSRDACALGHVGPPRAAECGQVLSALTSTFKVL